MLNRIQQKKVLEIWKDYISGAHKFTNASQEYSTEALDKERLKVIPEIKQGIHDYLSGAIPLEQFKSQNDSINKRHRLWGFKGMNGQMFFNMLYNCSSGASHLDQLSPLLKQAIAAPKDFAEAQSKIDLLASFAAKLADYSPDKRQAPRVGSCLFFLSFFWQIDDHQKWPVYYSSMVDVLVDESIWSPTGSYAQDYADFLALNDEARGLIKAHTGKAVSLWDVEHAFWLWDQDEVVAPGPIVNTGQPGEKAVGGLPTGYIPPIVSILPPLAKNDPAIVEACAKTGISAEKAFEERLGMLFKMAGYEVQFRGQGYGRVPDGIAISREYHYALIYDAKVRASGYSIGTDDRAIKEYILHETEILKRQGIRNVYFAVISSSFNGDFDDVIRTLKIETEIREVLFIEATALVVLLDHKLRNPEFDLGPKGVQQILAESGVITDTDMKEFLGI